MKKSGDIIVKIKGKVQRRIPRHKAKFIKLLTSGSKGSWRDSKPTLEFQLLEILQGHTNEHGWCNGPSGEGAVDVLCRIIQERDEAFKILALDRLRKFSA
jgi:hypothetical protein